MITVETRLQPGNLSPRASSWSEPSVMDTHEMWTTEQVNELLTSIDTGSGDPASPLDSNYTYVSAQTYNPPHVVLSPSWSLPRRQVGGDNNSALASLQQYQANNPLPDMSGLNVVSASGTSDSHSPMLSTPDMSGMLLGQSPPDMPAYHPFTTAQPHSVPFSAPAETYDFEGLDLFAQHQADLLQADHTQRQSSWPLSPPPLSTPSPLPQHMRAGTLPPEPPSAPPHIFGRRRSISMSGMELQAPVAVTASQTSSTGPVRPKPNRNRSASNLSHHRPTNQAQRTPGGSDSLYSVPRSPSAKERRAVASKRRATLQSVIAEAKLPSAPLSTPPPPSPPPPLPPLQQPQPISIVHAALQTPIALTTNTSSASASLSQALEALSQVQRYIEDTLGSSDDGDSGFVTVSHIHLLRDLKARLKAHSKMTC